MTLDPTSTTTDDVPDEILRSIHIAARDETVFAIISEPGWFVNDGEYREHEITTDGDISHVVDPVHGTFEIRTLELDPPHRAVFQWLVGQSGSLEDAPVNTIEFTLVPEQDGVLLTVRETGFAGLSATAAERRRSYEDNAQGWREELAVARTLAEAVR
ncbi:SRPBCC domain-containing protein [Brachybacterium sp.]|jgi:uncharacterized protein YndB with AHSA1/START domain|uniref:SRPBCC domain-containing protein n=1 Tax=Brachybacterium sp. TaxID=1891286 RepID=UPI002ED0C561